MSWEKLERWKETVYMISQKLSICTYSYQTKFLEVEQFHCDFDGLNLSVGASRSDTCQLKVIKAAHLQQEFPKFIEGCL